MLEERILSAIAVLLGLIVPILLVALAWMMFWLIPHAAIADAKCLEKGFPMASVTWTGKAYCMTLDGSVRVIVEETK